MKSLQESLLDDEDALLKNTELKTLIKNFFLSKQSHFVFLDMSTHDIRSKNFNNYVRISDDGVVDLLKSCSALIESKNITTLTNNGMFKWGKIPNSFFILDCPNLINLEGAPKNVGKNFIVYNCKNLKSLEGAPEKIKGTLVLINCPNLQSLKGCPKEANRLHCKNIGKFTISDIQKICKTPLKK